MDYSKLSKIVDDAGMLNDILEKHGYAYCDFSDVANGGKSGTRYRIVKSASSGTKPDPEGCMEELKQVFGDKVIFSKGANRHAPEQTVQSVIILDSEQVGVLKDDIYNAIASVVQEYQMSGHPADKEEVQQAIDWFMDRFFEESDADSDEDSTSSEFDGDWDPKRGVYVWGRKPKA